MACSSSDPSVCDVCIDGLYANDAGECMMCPEQCETC